MHINLPDAVSVFNIWKNRGAKHSFGLRVHLFPIRVDVLSRGMGTTSLSVVWRTFCNAKGLQAPGSWERLMSASQRSHPKSIGKKILRIMRSSTFQTFLSPAEFQASDVGHTPGDGCCTDVVTPTLNSSRSQLFKPLTNVFVTPLRHLLVQGEKERMVKREKKHL